ncbi:MAG: hypothetical protein WAU82_18755 [Candidatus Binatus sp.]|uniref:hypothetical protein n=1 Tax=Candidatus Binatus sp. TaxID=2811406 RepID=UPI003BAE740C
MKFSLRGLLIGSLGAAVLGLSPQAVSQAQAVTLQEIVLNADRVQIVHNGGGTSDSTNFNITFTNFGEGDCDGGEDDAIASGVEVALSPETCDICAGRAPCEVTSPPIVSEFPFDYVINPFVSHTVGHQTYGTFSGLNPIGVGPGTVTARIVLLSVPPNGCGTWNLNVEATGLDLSSITSNPMSIWLNDADDSGPFCFDINNAIIGDPIPKPVPVVRRGVRR